MQIQVFSPVRTGSTLVYNLLREIVDPSIQLVKTHQFSTRFPHTIATVRHPLNSIVSSCLRYNKPLDALHLHQNAREYLIQGGVDVCNLPSTVRVLRYEWFSVHIVECITALHIWCTTSKIPCQPFDGHALADKYQIHRIQKQVEQWSDFSQYDRLTHFHGRHISQYKGQTDYRTLLSVDQIQSLLVPSIQSICTQYQYPVSVVI